MHPVFKIIYNILCLDKIEIANLNMKPTNKFINKVLEIKEN